MANVDRAQQLQEFASTAVRFVSDSEFYYEVTDHWDSEITTWATSGAAPGPTVDWPMARLGDALKIVFVYLNFVFWGRLINRQLKLKLNLYPLKFLYNFAQMVLCSYMSIEAFLLARRNGYSFFTPCNVFDAMNPKIANLIWIFYMSKILDFVDTFVIVTGGKWKQLSFLHVYHHASIFLFYWLNLKVYYDGDVFLTIFLNAFVHAVMYTYYFITMQIPRLAGGQPSFRLWWKKYTTQLQMLQFSCMIAQAVYLWANECEHMHKNVVVVYLFYIVSLFALFLHFYVNSYSGKGKGKKKTK